MLRLDIVADGALDAAPGDQLVEEGGTATIDVQPVVDAGREAGGDLLLHLRTEPPLEAAGGLVTVGVPIGGQVGEDRARMRRAGDQDGDQTGQAEEAAGRRDPERPPPPDTL